MPDVKKFAHFPEANCYVPKSTIDKNEVRQNLTYKNQLLGERKISFQPTEITFVRKYIFFTMEAMVVLRQSWMEKREIIGKMRTIQKYYQTMRI